MASKKPSTKPSTSEARKSVAAAKKSTTRQAAQSRSATQKSTTKPTVGHTGAARRRIKKPRRKLFRRQDKRFTARPKLPNSFKLTKRAIRLMTGHWRVVGGMVLLYGILNILLVRGLNGGLDIGQLKQQADALFSGATGHVASGLTVFGLLLTSSNNVASAAASAYQTFLLIIVSLALVWTYRQLLAGNKVRIRDGFYRGMAPLVPVLLVLVVVGLELVPLVIGGWLYGVLIQNHIAITGPEQLFSFVVFIILASWSLYLLCSTLFALYIATLPDMTPLRAMRNARELVRYRRWSILRKLLFLPLFLLLIGALIMLPFILFWAAAAQWVFFLLSMVVLAVVHAYMFTLYRELLNE